MWGRLGLDRAPAFDEDAAAQARARQDRLTKPRGSLGRLEALGCQLCGIQGRVPPRIERTRVLVFAADHGITATHAVSPFPREVTAQMVANFVHGGAAINALCREVGASLCVYDVGVASPIPVPVDALGLVRRPVGLGTRSFVEEPAMTEAELEAALQVGVEAVDQAEADGIEAIALGEMGIGNTTSASALAAALLEQPASVVVGPGTGADAAMMRTKAEVIEVALARHGVRGQDGRAILRAVGGFEIAALVGATLRAVQRGIVVVCDGFIVTAAVAVALRVQPKAREGVVAGHASSEPAHRGLLEAAGLVPLLDLGLRLGEGSGAALALPLVRASAAILRDMATFDDARVSDRS